MSLEPARALEPRLQSALDELQAMIQQGWPAATFSVTRGHDDDDPEMVHLNATIDVDDTEAVVNLVIDRMLGMQTDEGLPIVVIPTRPLARILADRQAVDKIRSARFHP